MWQFLLGLFIGCIIGMVVISLCVVANRREE